MLDINTFYNEVIKLQMGVSKRRLDHKMKQLFGKLNFKDKIVLDIGGGAGLISFFVLTMGASEVVCLEPESDGSNNQMISKFNKLSSRLDPDKKVKLINSTFQKFVTNNKFDIVILHDSINHLNEAACEALILNKESKLLYISIFQRLFDMMNNDSNLIIADCSRHNFWDFFGLKNPIDNNINWRIHQSPAIWHDILNDIGFKKIKLKWSSFNRFGNLGSILLGNKLASYFLTSHFIIHYKR